MLSAIIHSRSNHLIAFEENLMSCDDIILSLRSKHPKIDVNSVARHFGGGGHREAAGAAHFRRSQ